jgi:tyrosine-specific transport protein
MNKTIGSTCMVAGTAIGAGMIALPMTLAKLGFLATGGLMAITWLIVYYSALLGTELTLRVGENVTLSEIARRLSGRGAEILAIGCIMILSYALLAAYLYGGSSISNSLLLATLGRTIPLAFLIKAAALFLLIVLTLGIRWIDYLNRLMFFALIGLLIVTIVGLSQGINLATIPPLTPQTFNLATWTIALPIIFTSFGFQMMIPAISGYLNRDSIRIKRAFFWGSLIPVVVYLTWTLSTLGTLTTNHSSLFDKVVSESIDVGEFVQMLSATTTWDHLQLLIWGVSFFAIITSAFGVALGLIDVWQKLLPTTIKGWPRQMIIAFITVIPPFSSALLTPGAFIKALGFAGMILVVIAIILPTYLIYKSDQEKGLSFYAFPNNHLVRLLGFAFAIGLIGCELFNMIG